MAEDLSLDERRSRYERVCAMRDAGMTLIDIGAAFEPPLSKQRVAQILQHPPARAGRPTSPSRRDQLRTRLRYWEARRLRRSTAGEDTAYADQRIQTLADQIAATETR